MQKNIFFILFFLLWSCTNNTPPKLTDWTKENLLGKVKKYIEQQYKPLASRVGIQGSENLGLLQKNAKTFNEQGFCVELIQATVGELHSTKKILEYNEQKQLVKTKLYQGVDTLTPLVEERFEYDKSGELISTSYYELGLLTTQTVYAFDETRKVKKGQILNSENTVISNTLALYSSTNKLINDACFNQEEQILVYRIYNQYDKEDKLVLSENYTPVGNTYTLSQKNKNGQEVELKRYLDGLISSACVYQYDDKGNQITVSCDIYENKVKRTSLSTIEYEYDSEQNWTKKTTFQDGFITYVVERIYIYY